MEPSPSTVPGIRVAERLPPTVARWTPQMAIRVVEKLFHLDEINAFWQGHAQEDSVAFLRSILRHLDLGLQVHGEMPDVRNAMVVCNHPTGVMDGLALTGWLTRLHAQPKALANSMLALLTPLDDLLLPIEKPAGANAKRLSRQLAQSIDDAMQAEGPILVFPAGQTAKLKWGGVTEMPWNKFVVQKAQRHQRDVIPLYLEGGLSWRFHTLSVMRRLLRLKTHPEAAVLIDEASRLRGTRLHVHVGERLPCSMFDGSKNARGWAAVLREKSLALRPTSTSTNTPSHTVALFDDEPKPPASSAEAIATRGAA